MRYTQGSVLPSALGSYWGGWHSLQVSAVACRVFSTLFCSFSFSFMMLTLLKTTHQLFCAVFFSLGLTDIVFASGVRSLHF